MIAVQLKPHTIVESLIIPACCEMVKIMFGDEATKKIMKIPRSNDTIKNKIKNMSDDIEKTVADKLFKRHFALQIDESTDISGKAHILGESMVSKTLPVALKPVLDKVVNMVNFIKSRPLKIRVFKNLCISMEAKYESLLLHTEVKWLSRGNVLLRFLELKDELMTFFQNENMDDFVEYL
ncbi:SCAN domain-containing protein 3-like [Hydra vulgaris]|uniref:SCAN domain-containing protein 3-like n=1 Tax=Hydra vulgaris TaxID=6087 RepID=A0ABM4CRF1_HYDVU